MTCTECGHALIYHGDRAIAACDGGYKSLGINGAAYGEARLPICSCTGWRPPK